MNAPVGNLSVSLNVEIDDFMAKMKAAKEALDDLTAAAERCNAALARLGRKSTDKIDYGIQVTNLRDGTRGI